MEIGSIIKTEPVEKGFYGESVEEEFIYSGIKLHRSQEKACGGGPEGRTDAHCRSIREKSWPGRPTLSCMAEDGGISARVAFPVPEP